MAETLRDSNKRVERKKFGKMAAAGVGTAGLFVIGAPWIFGTALAVGTGYLAWDWFKYRAKHGMRF